MIWDGKKCKNRSFTTKSQRSRTRNNQKPFLFVIRAYVEQVIIIKKENNEKWPTLVIYLTMTVANADIKPGSLAWSWLRLSFIHCCKLFGSPSDFNCFHKSDCMRNNGNRNVRLRSSSISASRSLVRSASGNVCNKLICQEKYSVLSFVRFNTISKFFLLHILKSDRSPPNGQIWINIRIIKHVW